MRKGPAAFAAMLLIAFGSVARAQPEEPAQPEAGATAPEVIVVLGLGADAELADAAAAMTRALRATAATVPAWRVHDDTAATLESAMQAHSCRAANRQCLERVANALDAARVVFGNVASEASGTVVTVTMHERGATALGAPAREPLPAGERADADYEGVAEALWARLAGAAYQPAPEAVAPPEEEIEEPAPPPEPEEDFSSFEMDAAPAPLTSTVEPVPAAEVDRTPWDDDRVPIGIGLAVAGGVLIGTSLYAVVRLNDLNDDPEFTSFRARVPAGRDVCDELDDGNTWGASTSEARHADAVCAEGKTLEVLGIVFLGAGIAAAGFGTALLIGASASEDHVAVSASGSF